MNIVGGTRTMKNKLQWLVLCVLVAATVAGPAAQAPPPVAPTFAGHVASIIFDNCTSCHRPGEATPFPLTNYEEVRRRARLIADVTGGGVMPPWHADSDLAGFRHDRRLTQADIKTLADWAAAGAPQGNASRTPPLPRFTPGWQLGEPDVVARMPVAMQVPEDGPDIYRNFAIPLGLSEGRWVRAIEFRPSGKASHHALFFFDTTGSGLRQDEADPAPGYSGMDLTGGLGNAGAGAGGSMVRALLGAGTGEDAVIGALGGWAVGGRPSELPENAARWLPAGSALVLQMHFHPSGKPETEQALIGIHFADAPPARPLLQLQLPPLFGALHGIELPAGASRVLLRDSFTLPIDVEVLSAGGHAHYLATNMKMTVTPPGGATRELLRIEPWDFSWQERYYFDQPIRLAAGTRVDAEIAYDNSAANPANPFSPPRPVRWGQQSTDEMGSITLEMLPVREQEVPRYSAAMRQHLVDSLRGRMATGGAGRGIQR
jgi:hypothetical protein